MILEGVAGQGALLAISFVANTLSSLAGGGAGLLQLPVLIFLGLAFPTALATHKIASIALGLGATLRHLRAEPINWRFAGFILLAGLPGVWLGTQLILLVPEAWARAALGVLTLGLGAYSMARPQLGKVHAVQHTDRLGLLIGGGVLFGIGLYELAIPGTVIALLVLAPFQWLNKRMPQENIVDLAVRARRSDPIDEPQLRKLTGEFGLWGSVINHRQRQDGAIVELSGSFRGKGVLPIDALAKKLAADPRVVEFDLLPRKD